MSTLTTGSVVVLSAELRRRGEGATAIGAILERAHVDRALAFRAAARAKP